MKCLVLVVAMAGIMVAPAWAETVTGIIDVQDFVKAQSKWKYHVANTSEKFDKSYKKTAKVRTHGKTSKLDPVEGTLKVRGGSAELGETRTATEKAKSWGAFFWCVNADKLPKIRYAYSYGERTEDQAYKKAAYAFDSMEGRCNEKGIRYDVVSSDDI